MPNLIKGEREVSTQQSKCETFGQGEQEDPILQSRFQEPKVSESPKQAISHPKDRDQQENQQEQVRRVADESPDSQERTGKGQRESGLARISVSTMIK